MLNKIKLIILSRITKNQNQDWIEDRRAICKTCPHNSKNNSDSTIKQKVYKWLSDLLTFLTGAVNYDLGQCKICLCDLYYKSKTESEICEDNRWKSIYIPNKKQKIY